MERFGNVFLMGTARRHDVDLTNGPAQTRVAMRSNDRCSVSCCASDETAADVSSSSHVLPLPLVVDRVCADGDRAVGRARRAAADPRLCVRRRPPARSHQPDRARLARLLWFCTAAGGLSRFDGSRFITCSRAEDFPHHSINGILEDADGTYWIATNG